MQILDDFLVKRNRGYYCSYGGFYIDPLYPVERAVVSHAHGDHASAGHQAVFCNGAPNGVLCNIGIHDKRRVAIR